ncbi:MAG TPA: RDD family protein [Streptosporangiaceae bacterium]|nr:RDD family protein [Streptosporangiaceae bacterium]
MSSMPERDAPGQVGRAQQSARPGEWGTPSQGTMPGHQQFGGVPSGGNPGQPAGDTPGGQWGSQPGSGSPVSEAETRVTWRRIFQFWIDAFLVSIVPYLASIPFDRSNSTLMNIVGGLVYVVLFVLIGLWYWVVRPHSHNGQTFAMQWLGLRVISKSGGPANATQLFIRWIGLLFDAAPWMWPITGLLGLVVMLCSRYRQRIGDHLARTLVISTRPLTYRSPQFAGQPGARAEDVGTGAGQPGTGQPGIGQANMGQPGTGQPGIGQANMGQAGTGQPGIGQPSMGPGKPGDIR